jgi:hypothetical protein
MINFERMWKEAVLAYFKELSQNLPGGAEENTRSSDRIAGLRFEAYIIRNKCTKARSLKVVHFFSIGHIS